MIFALFAITAVVLGTVHEEVDHFDALMKEFADFITGVILADDGDCTDADATADMSVYMGEMTKKWGAVSEESMEKITWLEDMVVGLKNDRTAYWGQDTRPRWDDLNRMIVSFKQAVRQPFINKIVSADCSGGATPVAPTFTWQNELLKFLGNVAKGFDTWASNVKSFLVDERTNVLQLQMELRLRKERAEQAKREREELLLANDENRSGRFWGNEDPSAHVPSQYVHPSFYVPPSDDVTEQFHQFMMKEKNGPVYLPVEEFAQRGRSNASIKKKGSRSASSHYSVEDLLDALLDRMDASERGPQ